MRKPPRLPLTWPFPVGEGRIQPSRQRRSRRNRPSLHPNRRDPVIPSLPRIILLRNPLQIINTLIQPQSHPAKSIIIKNGNPRPPIKLHGRNPVIKSRRQRVITLPALHAKIFPAKISIAKKASPLAKIRRPMPPRIPPHRPMPAINQNPEFRLTRPVHPNPTSIKSPRPPPLARRRRQLPRHLHPTPRVGGTVFPRPAVRFANNTPLCQSSPRQKSPNPRQSQNPQQPVSPSHSESPVSPNHQPVRRIVAVFSDAVDVDFVRAGVAVTPRSVFGTRLNSRSRPAPTKSTASTFLIRDTIRPVYEGAL